MNIRKLTALTDIPERQVRYLIAEGFMPPPRGGRSNAEYGDDHVAAIRRYTRLRELGFPPAAIKLLLGDQRIVAGLGNIYVCEALHRAGIHPKRAAGSVSLDRLKLLVVAIEDVLNEAIAAGGSTLRDFMSPDGELGYFSKAFAVYDREGQRCRCGGTVKRIVQGGRSTFYCPKCQH